MGEIMLRAEMWVLCDLDLQSSMAIRCSVAIEAVASSML